MGAEARRPQKTEVLSMRIDPKTRFLLDLVARTRGQSISTVVERAVQEAADNLTIGDRSGSSGRGWRDFWDVNEGIRFLKLASDPNTYPSFDDEAKLEFTKVHWPFFYQDGKCKIYKRWAVEILWPQIDNFMATWLITKTTDYFAAGKAMRQALSDAGVVAPDWPIKRGESEKPETESRGGWDKPKSADLDDDIPF